MKYRIMMSVVVDARGDKQALEFAEKLNELLKSPAARMLLASEGVQLSGDGNPVVHHPQPEYRWTTP